jgi:hypothetical protein
MFIGTERAIALVPIDSIMHTLADPAASRSLIILTADHNHSLWQKN